MLGLTNKITELNRQYNQACAEWRSTLSRRKEASDIGTRATDPFGKDGADPPCDTSFLAKRFKYRIPFEIGRVQINGGRIEISEVWGTRPQIEIGGQYLVRGKYTLPHGTRGTLHFYASAGGAWGKIDSLDLQSIDVDKQEGEFALVHGMAGSGYFHLILTEADRYSHWFADVYFGTGDNVYRDKSPQSPRDAKQRD